MRLFLFLRKDFLGPVARDAVDFVEASSRPIGVVEGSILDGSVATGMGVLKSVSPFALKTKAIAQTNASIIRSICLPGGCCWAYCLFVCDSNCEIS
jgi:hypothetical protein